VRLRPRPQGVGWVRPEQVLSLARKYGEFLPVDIVVHSVAGTQLVSRDWPPTAVSRSSDGGEPGIVAPLYGGLGAGPQFDAIPVSLSGTTGVIYISDIDKGTRRVRPNRVYVHRMLVSDTDHSVLPEWAFFAWAAIDSTGLSPTASPETLVEDLAWERTRDGLGDAIVEWLRRLADQEPERLQRFVNAHLVALKEVADAAPGLGTVIIPELVMDTTAGPMRVEDIVAASPTVAYTDSVDAFRRISALAPGGRLIVNAGYIHDVRILESLPSLYPGVTLSYADPTSEAAAMASPMIAEAGDAVAFETRASSVLSAERAVAQVKVFPDPGLPAAFLPGNAGGSSGRRVAPPPSSSTGGTP